MTNTFVQRLISMSVKLAAGKAPFPGGNNQATFEGLRIIAHCTKMATPSLGMLSLQVYGMDLDTMNQLSTLGIAYQQVPGNTITLLAGDSSAPNSLATVFIGTIYNAWADFSGAPDVAFHIEAQTLGLQSVTTTNPTSISGSADVGQIMSGLAGQIGATFENNGVNAKLSNPYFYGSPRTQIAACAKAAGCDWVVDNNVLAIMPKAQPRNGSPIVISPNTIQEGYPTFTQFGIKVKILFNPNIKYRDQIQIKDSQVTPANGSWTVYTLDHDIASRTPGGPWFTMIEGWNPKYPQPVPH